MSILNVEIKAKSEDNEKIREILKSKNADFKGEDYQIDTYFNSKNGRLKLREGTIENKLIHYERANQKGPKKSDILLYKANPGSALKELLTKANGVVTIVEKRREVYFIDNVKFQLDNVKNLGTFIEIEANAGDRKVKEEDLLDLCKFYMDLFSISESDLISASYSDLVLGKKN